MRRSFCCVWLIPLGLALEACGGGSGRVDGAPADAASGPVGEQRVESLDVGIVVDAQAAESRVDLFVGEGGADVALDVAARPLDMVAPRPMVDASPSQPGLAADVLTDVSTDLLPRPLLVPPLAPDAGPPGDCSSVVGADLLRLVEHPAGGSELTLRLAFKDGMPPLPVRDLSGCVSIEDRTGRPVGAVAIKKTLGATVQALLIDPGQTAAETAAVVGVVKALLADRPASDRIGLYRWGNDITQISGFLSDRSLATRLVGDVLAPDVRPRVPVADAVATVAPLLLSAGDVGGDPARVLLVLSARKIELPTAAAIDAARGGAHVLWSYVGAGAGSEGPSAARFELAVGVEKAIGERLLQHQTFAHLGVGLCGTGAAWSGQIRVAGGKSPLPFEIPAALSENLVGVCDHVAVASGRRVFPRRIEFVFTPAQRFAAEQAFGTRIAFALGVRSSPQQPPILATAHYRGKGSFRCQRPNFSLSLEGKRPRFWMPGSAGSQFLLISLCADSHYLRTYTMAQLLSAEGLYPGPFELVELTIDGQSRGVYLLTENSVAWIRSQHIGVQAVIRRNSGLEGTTIPDVEWSAGKPGLALQTYADILDGTAGLAGAALEQGLRSRMDLDGYLRWIALMTAFASGDYIDEIFFSSTASTDIQGRPRSIQTVFTWDPDDVFSPCHANGRFAIEDPWGLLFCTEAELDKRIFADPVIYRRYTDILEGVLARMPRARFEEAIGRTTARLLEHFRDPATLSAMTELGREKPDAIRSYAGIEAALAEESARLVALFDANRTTLGTRIAAYRLGPKP